ncbi:SnoaL_3 multi-domain protein [Pseudonocardia sp. EC080610-09]|nr:SnoaL_3 multi-domain protein [Pseudonocardia sp. EC080625-04]ALL76662.1 SnoaL_3 multi-domain protein [Pseudonocardia sp. EC080610-09]ALL83690.1 SnoaL_3 multi-domain protein [Pseudonocardia sp. EC080619-01]
MPRVDDTTTLLDLTHAWHRAIARNDADAIAAFMAPDWVLVDHDGVGTRENFLSLVATGRLRHSLMKPVPRSERVRVHGDLGYVTARVLNTAHVEGREHHADEWTTDVFVRRAGRWECVLSQVTAARPDDDG